jgi:hypothetical protein
LPNKPSALPTELQPRSSTAYYYFLNFAPKKRD